MHFTKGSCVEMYYWMNVERWWNGRNLLTSIYEHFHLRIEIICRTALDAIKDKKCDQG